MATPARILFLAEAVTLAHVARPLALSAAAHQAGFQTVLACHDRYQRFLSTSPAQILPLDSISSEQFMRQLALGRPVYNLPTLQSYCRQDLRLIESIQPDLIVGDFRLSLSVSARLAGVPYACIANAYWSPYAAQQHYPMPVLPITRYAPLPLARTLFNLFAPRFMAQHAKPLNALRGANGMASLGPEIRHIYTDADHTLYADCPTMFPMRSLPASHHFLGPILWSPPVELPAWWHQLPKDRPVVYLTLGSSGSREVMQQVLNVLMRLPLTIMTSSAGAPLPHGKSRHLLTADYLPGNEAAARADLVICNGGSPTSQQALANGVPVLGIVSNMDQFMNMEAIERLGAGAMMRADRVRSSELTTLVRKLTEREEPRAGARVLAASFAACDSDKAFCRFLTSMLPTPSIAANAQEAPGTSA